MIMYQIAQQAQHVPHISFKAGVKDIKYDIPRCQMKNAQLLPAFFGPPYLPVVVSVFAVVVSVLAHSSGLIPLQYGDTQKREFRWDDH